MTFYAFRVNSFLIVALTLLLLAPLTVPYTQETGDTEGLRDQLEARLAVPPGSEAELRELTALLNRYRQQEPNATLRTWYQYRVNLAAEYRRILDHTYFEGTTARFNRGLGRSLLATTYALREDVPTDTFAPAQQRILQDASRRNVRAFFGVMMLAADYQTVLGNVRDQTIPYDILFELGDDGIAISDTVYLPYAERTASRQMADEYRRSVSRQRPLLQALLVGAGGAGVTTSALILATGMPTNPTTDEDTPQRVARTAGTVGLAAIAIGTIAYVRSLPVPRQVMSTYLDQVGNRRFDTAINFFEGREEDQLFLVRGARANTPGGARRLQIGNQPSVMESGPAVYTRVLPGQQVTWWSVEIPEEIQTHIMHAGRNVLFVP